MIILQTLGCPIPQVWKDKLQQECAAAGLQVQPDMRHLFPHQPVVIGGSTSSPGRRIDFFGYPTKYANVIYREVDQVPNPPVLTSVSTQVPFVCSMALGPDNNAFLVVAGTNANHTHGYVSIFPADSSGLEPNFTASAEVAILSGSAQLKWPASMDFDVASATLYVLDWQTQKIVRIVDTNSDGVPDTLTCTGAATVENFPVLAETLSIKVTTEAPGAGGDLVCLLRPRPHQWDQMPPGIEETELNAIVDTDGNGTLDTAYASTIDEDLVDEDPGFLVTPCDSDTTVLIGGELGRPFEVALFDGLVTTVVASGTVSSGRAGSTVALSDTLMEGDVVSIRDPITLEVWDERDVAGYLPLLYSHSPVRTPLSGGLVTITGTHFASGITGKINGVTTTVTRISDTEVRVTLPALPIGYEDRDLFAVLELRNPGSGDPLLGHRTLYYDPDQP